MPMRFTVDAILEEYASERRGRRKEALTVGDGPHAPSRPYGLHTAAASLA
jgi:hypothetical protein